MKKILTLVGPTASGKSSWSIELAKRLNGEIISGDSIQVYRGFDIGSGKIRKEEMDGIEHHLIDVLDPKEGYNVADFQAAARQAAEVIDKKGKLPILVGGTGLYIKACLYDYTFSMEAKNKIDDDLLQMKDEELYDLLKKIDPKQCQIIHPHNRKRILRALMIARSGRTKSEIEAAQNHQPVYDSLILGLTCSRDTLKERISRRVDEMIAAGLKDEVKRLLDQGITFSHQAMQGIGYREWQPYFAGESDLEEVKEAIKTHSRQFAKRQYTWFNHQIPVTWLDIETSQWKRNGAALIDKWLQEKMV